MTDHVRDQDPASEPVNQIVSIDRPKVISGPESGMTRSSIFAFFDVRLAQEGTRVMERGGLAALCRADSRAGTADGCWDRHHLTRNLWKRIA